MKRSAPFGAWERSLALRYLGAIRAQRGVALVSVISLVAISLTVAVLVITMSIMNGFSSELFNKIMGFNGHVFLPPTRVADDAALDRVRKTPGVISAVPVVEGQAIVRGPDNTVGAIVRGLTPADMRASGPIAKAVKPQSALADFGQGESGGDVIIIGARMAQNLGVRAGDEVTLVSPNGTATAFGETPTSKVYVVGGVFSVGMTEFDQGFVYMPLSQAQEFFGRGMAYDYVEVRLADPLRAPQMHAAIAHAAEVPVDMVQDWTQKNAAFFGAVKVERSALRLILMMVIVLAALNIVSGLIMLVKNKARDIAILRTVGARPGSVLRIFLMDGGILGVTGTVCGVILGVIFCLNIQAIQAFIEWITGEKVFNADVYFLAHVPAKIDWIEVLGVSVFTVTVSLLITLIPAWLASRTDPVEALRFE